MLMRPMNPWEAIHQVREEMARLFDEMAPYLPMAERWGLRRAGAFPALNLWEDEQNIYAEAELPGLRMEDLEVYVVGNELTIKGERKDEFREKAGYHRRERGVGAFSRVLQLPAELDADRVEAVLKNGVLTITLPKAEKAKPRKVQVKALTK